MSNVSESYKIIESTDSKYIGDIFEIDKSSDEIIINMKDGYEFEVDNMNEVGDITIFSNSNYIIRTMRV